MINWSQGCSTVDEGEMCDSCSEQVAKLKRIVALTLFEMLIGGDNACLASWMHHM